MTGALPRNGWVPDPLSALGIGIALVGTLGAFIGTRPWPETEAAYQLSNSVLIALFLFSVGTTSIAIDLSFSRVYQSKTDLLTPILSLGATATIIYFANAQTVLWSDLRRLHLQHRINAISRMHSNLWRTYTRDDAHGGPDRKWSAIVLTIGAWIFIPTTFVVWVVLLQGWSVVITVLMITTPLGMTALTVLATRQLIIQTAGTPNGGILTVKAITISGTALLVLQIVVLNYGMASLFQGAARYVWLAIMVGHILAYAVTAILAITEHHTAMRLTGTKRIAIIQNAQARAKLSSQREQLRKELCLRGSCDN